jgi:hypothetical protein
MAILESPEALIQAWLTDGLDAATGALKTIDVVHEEVHEGEMFLAEYSAASVADGGTVRLVLTAGARQPHLSFNVSAGGACQVYLYEGSTSVGGTAVPTYSYNRSGTITPTMAVAHSPSAGTVGTVALVNGRYLAGGNSSNTRIGGGVRQGVEFMFAPSTKYILDTVNKSGGAITVNVATEWYEETV